MDEQGDLVEHMVRLALEEEQQAVHVVVVDDDSSDDDSDHDEVEVAPPARVTNTDDLPYPISESHPEAADRLPATRGEVFPRLRAILETADVTSSEQPLELELFIEYLSVYKSYTAHEGESWVADNLEGCVNPVLDILNKEETSPFWLQTGLQLVYILARNPRACRRLESADIYSILLAFLDEHLDKPEVLVALMLALGNLTFLSESLRQLVQMGFASKILEAIRANPKHPKLCEASIWALANLFYTDHDVDLKLVVLEIVAVMRRFPMQTPLVCEACYALYNLASSTRFDYVTLMVESGVVEYLITRLKHLRTTQFFVPALDLIARLVSYHDDGPTIARNNLETLVSVMMPGPVEQFCFGQVSSFVPQDQSIKIALSIILHRIRAQELEQVDVFGSFSVYARREYQPRSLFELAGAVVLRAGLVEEQLPRRVHKRLEETCICTACGDTFVGKMPIVVAHVTDFPEMDRYEWLCSRTCEQNRPDWHA
eukprot:m.4605 g.4605  ORF g.4605 m.4605 type:complete len:487 (+) comp2434_c0_seq1:95-1555(+)